jgi:hypothetical protein
MKNIHILPTDKPSRLALQLDCKPSYNLQLSKIADDWTHNWEKQNIYITSDEEIKEGDWCLDLMNDKIYVATKVVLHNLKSLEYEEYLKKIILTTDQDLIKDGVQAIDDDFLEWFVKNPSCEEVEVDESNLLNTSRTYLGVDKYKIIIPKKEPKQDQIQENHYDRNSLSYSVIREEPKQGSMSEAVKQVLTDMMKSDEDLGLYEESKQFDIRESNKLEDSIIDEMSNDWETMSQQITFKQETLEEAAEKYVNYQCGYYTTEQIQSMNDYIAGYKLAQERSYSEEEVIAIVEKSRETGLTAEYLLLTEQFKKK